MISAAEQHVVGCPDFDRVVCLMEEHLSRMAMFWSSIKVCLLGFWYRGALSSFMEWLDFLVAGILFIF